MELVLLLLGLVPLVFLGDLFPGAGDDHAPEEAPSGTPARDDATGAFHDLPPDDAAGGAPGDTASEDVGAPLLPDTGDDMPFVGDTVDPETVLKPDIDDDSPFAGDAVDPADVIKPTDAAPDGGSGAETTLQRLIAAETDLHTGVDRPGLGAETTEYLLEDGGDDTIDQSGEGDEHLFGGTHGAAAGDGNAMIDHQGQPAQGTGGDPGDFDGHIDGAADRLDGGAGDGTLIMDRAGSATGGAGADTFWIYFDHETGTGFVDIRDFETGTDFLRVTLNPDLDHGDMAVEVAASPDGQDGMVSLNGEVIVMLRGAPGATLADVVFEVAPGILV